MPSPNNLIQRLKDDRDDHQRNRKILADDLIALAEGMEVKTYLAQKVAERMEAGNLALKVLQEIAQEKIDVKDSERRIRMYHALQAAGLL